MHVTGLEGTALSAGDGLLTERLHVERRLALAVSAQHASIEAARQHHVAKPTSLLVRGQLRHPVPDRVAVVVEDADQLLAHQRDTFDLLVERRLRHLPRSADEAHLVGLALASGWLGDAQSEWLASRVVRIACHRHLLRSCCSWLSIVAQVDGAQVQRLVITEFLGPVEASLRNHGLSSREARDVATGFLAMVRGLQVDLAVSGDQRRVDEAMYRYIDTITRTAT